MDADGVKKLYSTLEEKVRQYNPHADFERMYSAFEFADKAHAGQLRKDGSPFVTHPLAVAIITAEMGLDEDSLIACLLHDTIEDTDTTHEQIAHKFGTQVADIVEGVTKLTRVVYTSKEDEQMENLRKMLMAMAKDIRVIIIKIADRLHNMRTMAYQSEAKQREKALETMEIYAPIAYRLGIQKIKLEMEDLALFYLDPVGYNEITDELKRRQATMDSFMGITREKLVERMKEAGIECTIYDRIKHVYSIYRKMYSQNKGIDEVFDLCAFRVIVNSLADCYNVLGQVHDMFKPIPGRFKDYISTPKPNLYQSLHTTVIGSEGMPFEIQIRTWEMHQTAEYGIAAHWKYKQGIAGKTDEEEKFAWIRTLLEAQQDTEAQEFVHDLKVDMFSDEVFVFTPNGDVINLPAGATPIDFAYSIHSAVGNRMVGAKVNGRMIPFDHVLQNGDIVEVITSSASKGPSRDWINIAKSSEARGKIKQWLKKERREENIIHGKASFEAEMRRNKLSLSAAANEEILAGVLKKLSAASMDDVYAAIGYGGMTSVRVVNRVREELIHAAKAVEKVEAVQRLTQERPTQKKTNPVHGIIVEGVDNCLVKFARCCTPVPGDDIVGFITRGYGVSVHRGDCQNYLNARARGDDLGRWIDVEWSGVINESYHTALVITARERSGIVMDIATVLNSIKTNVSSLNVRNIGDGKVAAYITIEVKNRGELLNAVNRLSAIADVLEAKRAGS